MEKSKVFIERAALLSSEGIRAVCGTKKEYGKYVKKIMTDLAAGHITKEEADILIKDEKVAENKPVKEFEGKSTKDTHKRKKQLNQGGKIL